ELSSPQAIAAARSPPPPRSHRGGIDDGVGGLVADGVELGRRSLRLDIAANRRTGACIRPVAASLRAAADPHLGALPADLDPAQSRDALRHAVECHGFCRAYGPVDLYAD